MFVKFVEFMEILHGFGEIARYSWRIMGNCGNTGHLKNRAAIHAPKRAVNLLF